jgi:hypothetical protein
MTFFQENFTPYSNVIIAISNTNPAIVVTLTDHGYDDGLFVRLLVPLNCGMQQIQGQTGEITVLAPNAFSLPIDSTNYDAFAYTSSDQVAQAIPVGENAFSLTQAERNAKNITPEF